MSVAVKDIYVLFTTVSSAPFNYFITNSVHIIKKPHGHIKINVRGANGGE